MEKRHVYQNRDGLGNWEVLDITPLFLWDFLFKSLISRICIFLLLGKTSLLNYPKFLSVFHGYKLQYALKIIIVKFFSISDRNLTLLYIPK